MVTSESQSLIEAAAEREQMSSSSKRSPQTPALRTAPKANYQLRTVPEGESQHEMLRALETG